MFVRTLRFLKLPNRGSPYPQMPLTSRIKNKVSKEKTEQGGLMEMMNIKDVPEPSIFVEIRDTDTSNDTENLIPDESAEAAATGPVEPGELNTESLPSTNLNGGSGDDEEFTQQEVETLWHETLGALSGMLNDGEMHPCYRKMLQVERCCDENNTNTNHTCYERWRDGVVKQNNSM